MSWFIIHRTLMKNREPSSSSDYEPPVTSEEFERESLFSQVIAFAIAALVAIAFVAAIMAFGASTLGVRINIITAGPPAVTPAPQVSGDELIFPNGWTPLTCASFDYGRTGKPCVWICKSMDVIPQIRECSPVGKPHDAAGAAP